jgi:hypothetical protein
MTPEELLAPVPPHLRRVAEWLRAVVRRAVPDAIEAVRPGWRLIGYNVPVGRRAPYFAFIWPEVEHVHLGFEHGVQVRDPAGVLRGAELRLRKVRFVTLRSLDEIPGDVLEALARDAARVAALGRAERLTQLLDRAEIDEQIAAEG